MGFPPKSWKAISALHPFIHPTIQTFNHSLQKLIHFHIINVFAGFEKVLHDGAVAAANDEQQSLSGLSIAHDVGRDVEIPLVMHGGYFWTGVNGIMVIVERFLQVQAAIPPVGSVAVELPVIIHKCMVGNVFRFLFRSLSYTFVGLYPFIFFSICRISFCRRFPIMLSTFTAATSPVLPKWNVPKMEIVGIEALSASVSERLHLRCIPNT